MQCLFSFRIKTKQSSEVFYKKAVFINFTIFKENTCVGVFAGLRNPPSYD